MRKKCFVLVIIAMSILLSFCPPASTEESKVFPGQEILNNSNIQFNGFISSSATFSCPYHSNLLFFTIKKLPKQIGINDKKIRILGANTNENWIIISDEIEIPKTK